MLGVVRREVILDFDALVDLSHQPLRPCEDNVVQLGNEAEEVSVESDSVIDPFVEIFHVVVGLESVHVHGEALRTDFLNPEANYVALVKD